MIVGGEDFDDTFGDMPDSRWNGMDFVDQYGEQLLLLIILICAVALVYWAVKRSGRTFGRKSLKSRHRESAEAIYHSVKWHLDRALKSSGAVILERGREVAEVLNARLGLVIDISAKTQKLYDDIKDAGNAQKKPAGAPKVKVAKATRDQYFDVRDALEELNEFWTKKDDKGRPLVLSMIEAAQHELATGPKVQIKAPDLLFGLAQNPKLGKPATAKSAGPVNAAPTAAAAPPATANPIVIESVPPPEPSPPVAPPPERKKGKPLPAHKRNMLA